MTQNFFKHLLRVPMTASHKNCIYLVWTQSVLWLDRKKAKAHIHGVMVESVRSQEWTITFSRFYGSEADPAFCLRDGGELGERLERQGESIEKC